jgi:hypothetical protein
MKINGSAVAQLSRYGKEMSVKDQQGGSRSLSKSQLTVVRSRDGGLFGKVKVGADGKVQLPGGLALQAPAAGGVATHQLSPNQLLVLRADAKGVVSVSTRNLGLAVDQKKGSIKGDVLPTPVEGQKTVEIAGMGSLMAPQPGKTDAYLLGPDKLLSLKSNDDGSVSVNTKTLGLEADKKGNFKGDVLPVDGKVDIAGKEIDVSGLKPGKTMKKTIKINGKKYKVKLRMNADGTVSVEGKRKRSFFSKVAGFIGKALNFVGKFAPFLAAIPGIGTAVAIASKVISGINAVRGFVDSIKTGNILGAIGSAASFVGGFAKGVVGSIANKISEVTGFAQQALSAFKHGLGNGFLQVVSNGASLLSGGAGLVGANGVASTAGQVANYAGMADSAAKGNLLPAVAHLANTYGPKAIEDLQRRNQPEPKYSFHGGILFNTRPSASDFGVPFDPNASNFSSPASSGGSSGKVVSDVEPRRAGLQIPRGGRVEVAQYYRPDYEAMSRVVGEFKRAVDAMNKNGNRAYGGLPLVGNVVDNFRDQYGLGKDKWWKCEDQAPFTAEWINRANIPGVRAGIQWDSGHTWVVVNVGGTQNKDGSWDGGVEMYLDPWANHPGSTARPGTPIGTEWNRDMIRSNIEPDAPRF